MGTRFAVCPRCEGRGTHVNPAVDGNGLTAEDIDEQGPDFLEDYLGGVYDVQCEECGGQRVVPACRAAGCGQPVHAGVYIEDDGTQRPFGGCWDHLTEDERNWAISEADMAATYAAELRMGA
jgi:hypothetical protein